VGGRNGVVILQNSGLGNAVSPLTSLAYTFHIPLLLIVTLRGDPQLTDEPQHELMGQITGDLLDTLRVPWEFFPRDEADLDAALERADAFMSEASRPYALVMKKGTVAPHALRTQRRGPRPPPPPRCEEVTLAADAVRPSRTQVLQRVVAGTPLDTTVVIATTGFTGRELFALGDRSNQLYMVGSMGCASSFGLGLSMARPDLRVVVVDGDGAALMRMGNFATIGAYGGANLSHLVLDNGVHESTGGQATVSHRMSFAGVAGACGYRTTLEGDDPALVDRLLDDAAGEGPRFGCLHTRRGAPEGLPRPDMTPPEVLRRLMRHIGSADFAGRRQPGDAA